MAAPTNTVTSVNNVGEREDLEDDIYRVAPEKTPFSQNIGRTKAEAIQHDWQTEDLRTPNANNAKVEGFDVGTHKAPNVPVRVSNFCQLFSEDGVISETQEVVKKAGRDSEVDRQKMLKGIEVKRDVEMRLIGNYPSQNEGGAIVVDTENPRLAAGAIAWSETVNSRGGGGADGGFSGGTVSASTPGTARAFTETLVKSVLATGFSEGASYSQAYMGPTHKQAFSAFTGIAEIRHNQNSKSQASIIGAADVYVSDFGNITLIPHPYGLTDASLFIDPSMLAIATLRGMNTRKLARTGDNERFLMTCEKTLVVRNEKAIAPIEALS